MTSDRRTLRVGPILLALAAAALPARADEGWSVTERGDGLRIARDGREVGTWVFGDGAMRRPGLANLHAPGGTPVTRAFPPREGIDATDHAAMHPGVWIAFGDVSGEDFWRNKGRIEQDGFDEAPTATADGVRFAARGRMVSAAGDTLATITNRVAIADRPEGRVVAWQATIRPAGRTLVFGDQEEMGFGVRLATGLEEKVGGRIENARGDSTAAGTWGREAPWCRSSGMSAPGKPPVAITVVADPGNFRPPWWHNRDYGLLVANPFGRQALARGEPSRLEVAPEESLRLGFAAILADGEETRDGAAAAAAGLALLGELAPLAR